MFYGLSVARVAKKPLTVLGLSLCGHTAWAGMGSVGGAIDYAPLSSNLAAVPTLGEWMLVLMALLLAVVTYRALRGRVNGRLLSNLTLAGGAVAASAAGHGLIQEAWATYADEQNMSSTSGGTVEAIQYWTRLTNTSGVPLKITAIRPNEWSRVVSPPPAAPECTVNLVISPGNACNVAFDWLYN